MDLSAGVRTAMSEHQGNGTVLGKPAVEGESPVRETCDAASGFQSTTRHEKPCRNMGGPPPKAKYYLVTDSA